MKKVLYILGSLLLLVIVVAVAGIIYLNTAFPKVSPAEDITIEPTQEHLERGEYLVKHVTMCLDCHSKPDRNYYANPIIPGTEGMGGQEFSGVGKLFVPNITPAALSDWTDGEIARAITAGVTNDGRPLAPMMPYSEYRYLAKEDVYAIVVYLRTLPPIENKVPKPSINFPLNLIFRTIPSDPDPQPLPDSSDILGTGKYLVRVAGCYFCHTPNNQGTPIPDKDFSGGHEFSDPELGTVRSANITPDMETGIGSWNKESFIKRFKAYEDSAGSHIPYIKGGPQTVMPWTILAGMTEEDLGTIYDYLQTVSPIKNSVQKFTPPDAMTQAK
jgi:mono/diheme cytochrome c family protein